MKRFIFGLLCSFLVSQMLFAATSTSFAPFEDVYVTGKIEVTFVVGEEEKVTIEDREDKIRVEQSGKVLKIKRKGLADYRNYQGFPIRVTVMYKALRFIKASAGADIRHEGAGYMGDKLTLRLASGATGKFEVQANALEVHLTEGAQMQLEGSTENLNVDVSTGASLRARRLESQRAYARATTGGDARVFAAQRLEANANTGGNIRYHGDPAELKVRDNLGGGVYGS